MDLVTILLLDAAVQHAAWQAQFSAAFEPVCFPELVDECEVIPGEVESECPVLVH